VRYEIDLSEKNAKKMREGLRPWVDAGQRIGGSRRRRAASKAPKFVNGHAKAVMRSPAAAGSQPRCSTLIGPPSSAKIAAAATAGIADSVDTLPYLLGEIRILRCAHAPRGCGLICHSHHTSQMPERRLSSCRQRRVRGPQRSYCATEQFASNASQ